LLTGTTELDTLLPISIYIKDIIRDATVPFITFESFKAGRSEALYQHLWIPAKEDSLTIYSPTWNCCLGHDPCLQGEDPVSKSSEVCNSVSKTSAFDKLDWDATYTITLLDVS
jgi:hypothetical protein